VEIGKRNYLLLGGWVSSKSDGELHYVSATKLLRLYGLDPRECILVNDFNGSSLRGVDLTSLIVLGPRFHGDYHRIARRILEQEGLWEGRE